MCLCAQLLSHVQPFATLWTVDCQPPLFMGVFQILEWVVLSSSTHLPNPGINPESPASLALQVDSLPLSNQGNPDEI